MYGKCIISLKLLIFQLRVKENMFLFYCLPCIFSLIDPPNLPDILFRELYDFISLGLAHNILQKLV